MTNVNKNEDKDRKRSEIYVLAIEIIFGVVIGVSFTDYHEDLVPFIPNFNSIMILVAYTTVLASLIGYNITIRYRYHKNISRFVIDVLLLFLYFQLIYSPKHDLELFFSIFPWIFGLYLIWGVLEHFEYKKNMEYSKVPFYQRILNFSISFALSIMIWAYYSFYHAEKISAPYGSATIIDWLLLFLILSIVLGFRIYSWITGKLHGTHDN